MIEFFVIFIGIVLIFFARPLSKYLFAGSIDKDSLELRVLFTRAVIVPVILLLTVKLAYPGLFEKLPWLTRILYMLATIYILYLLYEVVSYLITRHFGEARTVGDEQQFSDTYSSRALTLLAGIVLFVIGLILCVRILGFDSLLEAGGVLGVVGVFLALTQASWAPDIISGLVILNSRMAEEGDVIQLGEDDSLIGVVFKTKMFHTEILNLANNHRFMVKNSKLRDYNLHNLSKFASARGLRECLEFNIDYAVPAKTVRTMFESVYEQAVDDNLQVNESYAPEIGLLKAGDYAVTWGFFYYIKEVRQVLSTRHEMQELVLEKAKEQGISLATPMLQFVEHKQTSGGPSA